LLEALGGKDAVVRPDARDDMLGAELRADLELRQVRFRIRTVGDACQLDIVDADPRRGERALRLTQQLRIR
jgi:hypothetical protein